MPLGDARLLSPVVMVNLLGDAWRPVSKTQTIGTDYPRQPWNFTASLIAGLNFLAFGSQSAQPTRSRPPLT
jgi:hypothetical protein